MKNTQYLLLDLDGCIGGGKGTTFDLALMQRLKSLLADAPFAVGACTGRSAAYVEVVAQMLGLAQWCVCENGVYLFHPITETFIFHPSITADKRCQLAVLKNTLQARHNDPADIFAAINVEYGKELCVSLNHPHWSVEELLAVVEREIDTEGLHIGHSAAAIDITPQGIDKGSGVLLLAEHLQIPLSQFAGIGDSDGDRPTFELVGTCACPANATPALKQLADYVAKPTELAGVIDIVEWLLSRD